MVTDGGFEVGFHGEYLEIVPNERIVTTEVYEGLPEGVSEEDAATVNTATFTEADGRTTLTLLVQATSKVSRDAIIDPGWRPACRTRWTSSSRSRSHFAEPQPHRRDHRDHAPGGPGTGYLTSSRS